MKKNNIYIHFDWQWLYAFSAFLSLLMPSSLLAQQDSAQLLNEVEIVDFKLNMLQQTSRFLATDPSFTNRLNCSTVADLLSSQGCLFVKDYGGGRLSTVSIRGTSAGQNAVSWNGLMLNNPALGLTDLSLIPSFFIDDVAIQYGGSGAVNGSNAMGGAIHLSSLPSFNKGLSASLFSSYASFEDAQYGIRASYSNSKYAVSSAFYGQTALNNFDFTDQYILSKPFREQAHAHTKRSGLTHNQAIFFGKNLMSLHVLWLKAEREIPPLMGSFNYSSRQDQHDEQLRLVSEWKHDGRGLQTVARFGLAHEAIIYSDGLTGLNEKSQSVSYQAEGESKYSYRSHAFSLSLYLNSANAYTGGYSRESLLRSALTFAYKYHFRKLISYHITLKKELVKENDYPLLPSAGVRFAVNKNFSVNTNGALVYRTPSLNDLYWQPGGNLSLKPETGTTGDVRLEYHFSDKNFSLFCETGYYRILISNWILWAPGNDNIWSPENLQKVLSQGSEALFKLNYKITEWNIYAGGNYQYILATLKESNLVTAGDVLNKQLIYTPKVQWQVNVGLGFKETSLKFIYNYTGYRYKTADNKDWLDPYGTATVIAAQKIAYRKGAITITASVNNLFDEMYEVVALHPMPGRWYKASIFFTWEKKKDQ